MANTKRKRRLVVICCSVSKRARELIELESDACGRSMSRTVDRAIMEAYDHKYKEQRNDSPPDNPAR